MRLRNVKNKDEILNQCTFLIRDGEKYRGKWKEIFQNDHPIYVEIGMGKGKFLLENARRYPNINFVGIEKFDSVLAKAIERLENLPNLRVIRMDASFIHTIFDHEIDLLYLNFSDPWPKKRHWNRRLTSPLFLKEYDVIFKEKKNIELKTDNEEFFIYSMESLSKHHYVLSDLSFDYHKQKDDIIMTDYEVKFVSKGCKIYHLFAQK